jgi:hypothetical protein
MLMCIDYLYATFVLVDVEHGCCKAHEMKEAMGCCSFLLRMMKAISVIQ